MKMLSISSTDLLNLPNMKKICFTSFSTTCKLKKGMKEHIPKFATNVNTTSYLYNQTVLCCFQVDC